MEEQITVCQVQPDLVWEDIDANLSMMEGMLTDIQAGTDLIMLPETFSTGFTMQSDRFAEEASGKAVNWMAKTAVEHQAYVTGSVIIRENSRIYQPLVLDFSVRN